MNDFSQTFHSIRFGESCSVVQNFYSFFVGTAHKGSRVIAVEAVSIDGQQVTAVSHCITKKSQMTIIDVSAEMQQLKNESGAQGENTRSRIFKRKNELRIVTY